MTSSDFSHELRSGFLTSRIIPELTLYYHDSMRSLLLHGLLSLYSVSLTPMDSSVLHFQNFRTFHGLRLQSRGSTPICPLYFRTRQYNDAVEFTLCYGLQLCRSFASSHQVTPMQWKLTTWLSGDYHDRTFIY